MVRSTQFVNGSPRARCRHGRDDRGGGRRHRAVGSPARARANGATTPAAPTARDSSPRRRSPRRTSASSQVAWTYPAGQTDFNPLVVRGVVYGRGAERLVRRARRGDRASELWVHDGVQGFNVRGVNYWESKDGKDRRLIFSAEQPAAGDRRADRQARSPSFGTDGHVDLRVGPRPRSRDDQPAEPHARTRVREPASSWARRPTRSTRRRPATSARSTCARASWCGRSTPCRVPASSATTPGPTDAWKTVGGANNWGEQSIDEKRGIVYVPTGSPKYNFYGGNRKGANLFGDCLIALDARTGKRLWHFQTVHHDIWDLDNNSAPQLIDHPPQRPAARRRRGGQQDRLSLRLRSRDRQADLADRGAAGAARHDVPGEALWPTQPFPTAPPPFSRQKFTADDVNPYILTPERARAVQAADR